MKRLIGIDEAGRGPIAGPVAVAVFAVSKEVQYRVLDFFPKRKVRDSKKLAPAVREQIFKLLQKAKTRGEISYAVSFSSTRIIDRRGITFAIRRALATSLKKLGVNPRQATVLLDGGLKAPEEFIFQRTIIKGDEKEPVIALASFMAKVSRDRKMRRFALKYPRYGFEAHKGYGTRAHYKALKKYGLSAIHRRSFLKNIVK